MGYSSRFSARQYAREWIRRRRAAWISEHGPCVRCGSLDQLEADHIDPALKAISASQLWSMSPTNPKRIAELAKCQVLCRDCHWEKTHTERLAKGPEYFSRAEKSA